MYGFSTHPSRKKHSSTEKMKSVPFFPHVFGWRDVFAWCYHFPQCGLRHNGDAGGLQPALLFDRLDFQLLRRWIFVETIQLSFGLSLNTIPLVITHTIPYLCMVKLYIYIWIFMAKKVNDTWMPCVKGSQTQTDKERQIHCA